MKKEWDLASEAQAKQEREDAQRASAARIDDIKGKLSWRSRGMRDENKAETAGLIERAGNVRTKK
jgi:hypothetical protein